MRLIYSAILVLFYSILNAQTIDEKLDYTYSNYNSQNYVLAFKYIY